MSKENLEYFKNVTAQDIICSQVLQITLISSFVYLIVMITPSQSNFFIQNSDAHLNEEDVIVTNIKIDLANGRNNPLERYLSFLLVLLF